MNISWKKVVLVLSVVIFLFMVFAPAKIHSDSKKGKLYFHGDGWAYCDCSSDKVICTCSEPEPEE